MSTSIRVSGYEIAEELFTKGMQRGEGPCKCSAACCLGGVYADVAERDLILKNQDIVRKYLDETQPKETALWFEDREFEDSDFRSGRCVGTREVNEKCAFLDRQGRCSLQVAGTEEGLGRWFFKPLFCVLYPIEITDRLVQFDDLLQDDQACCSVSDQFEVPLFEVCREELSHLLGSEGFSRMEEIYESRSGGGFDQIVQGPSRS